MSPWMLVVLGAVVVLVGGVAINYALSRRAMARDLTEIVWTERSPVRQVYVTIVADTSRFDAAMRRAAEAVLTIMCVLDRTRAAKLAGLGSRFYMRGGLECRTVEQLDLLVQSILTVPNEYHAALADAPVLALLPVTRQERCELAVEAMKGYVLHMDPWRRPDPEPAGNRYVTSWTTWHWWGGGRAVVDNVMTGRNYNGWGPIPNGMSTPPGRQVTLR